MTLWRVRVEVEFAVEAADRDEAAVRGHLAKVEAVEKMAASVTPLPMPTVGSCPMRLLNTVPFFTAHRDGRTCREILAGRAEAG